MDISTQQLRHFMELAKHLNFTKAAMNLYIAQPALSQQIADLEKQLGVTLFNRTSRSVSLTPAGEILQQACPEILRKMDRIQKTLLAAQAGMRGNLTIGHISAFQRVLPQIVQKYLSLYPDVAVDFCYGNLKDMKDSLRNQESDIVFSGVYPEMFQESDTLTMRPLWTEDICLLVRKDHPFARSGGQDYSLLRNETFSILDDTIILDYLCIVQKLLQERGLSGANITAGNSWATIMLQVEAGMTVSVFSEHDCTISCTYRDDLTYFPIRKDCLTFCALWNPNSQNASLPLFLDVLDAAFQSYETE